MVRLQKPSLFFTFTIIIAFTIITVFPGRISGQVKPITEVQEKLEGISGEEKNILKDLFVLSQEIEEMDREEAEITQEIQALQSKIGNLENMIKKQQKEYDNQMEILRKVLVSYQRSGPASYIDTLLNAKDLTAFLLSINTINDLTRNVGELLDSLDEWKKKLSEEKKSLAEDVAALEDKKKELQEHLAEKLRLKEKQEAYLNSLQEERKYYEEQLNNLQQMWDEIKIMFSKILGEFTRIMEEGKLPLDAFQLSFDFPVVRGTLYEKTFNDILTEQSSLQGMVFHFYPDKAEIEIPEKHLVLTGTFSAVKDSSTLKFEAREGSFYEMPLETASIKELFQDGYLLIDFKNLTGNITFESIETKEGYLEFVIKPDF